MAFPVRNNRLACLFDSTKNMFHEGATNSVWRRGRIYVAIPVGVVMDCQWDPGRKRKRVWKSYDSQVAN